MLFSEPKISQCHMLSSVLPLRLQFQCSSASRKFLNKQLPLKRPEERQVSVLFSEPKISQSAQHQFGVRDGQVSVLFSEPKISQFSPQRNGEPRRTRVFQCSSASRKFLNHLSATSPTLLTRVSVLFSEPKISQSPSGTSPPRAKRVSVLFSEPKISQ